MPIQRAAAAFALSAAAAISVFAGSAYASHGGAEVTCDNGDEFTIRAAENSAGFQSPTPFTVLLFEEGGVLTVHTVRVDGNLLFSHADTGRAQNAVTEVSCWFRIGAGAFFEVTGVLNAR
jgi:hypothetical protein